MNGSTMAKKILPVLLAVVILIVIGAIGSSVLGKEKLTPSVTEADKIYISIDEDGKTYSVTKGEMYDELKNTVGLSSMVTLVNKTILKTEKNGEGVSYFEAVKEDDIKAEIDEAIYGEDVKVEDLTAEEKEEKVKEFLDSMFKSYGYKADDVYATIISDHYRLILAKKAYASDQLAKSIAEQNAKAEADESGKTEGYFEDDKISEYYGDNYNKQYWGIIVPFATTAEAENALQQLGVMIDRTSDAWYHIDRQETVEGSGIYENKLGEVLTVEEVVETFIKLYNMVYGHTVEGGKVLVDGKDYEIVDVTTHVETLTTLATSLKAKFENNEDFAEIVKSLKDEIAALEVVLKAKGYSTASITSVLEKFISKNESYTAAESEGKEALKAECVELIEDLSEVIAKVSKKAYVFNKENNESPLYYDYDKLSGYNSTLPNKFNNTYTSYYAFATANTSASLNKKPTWYSHDYLSLTNNSKTFYAFALKISEIATPTLEDVKDEIIEKLTEEALTESYIETKIAQLRENYDVVIYDSSIENDYVSSMTSYAVNHEANKEESSELVAELSANTYEKIEVANKKAFKAAKKANKGLYVYNNGLYEVAEKYAENTVYYVCKKGDKLTVSTEDLFKAMEETYGMTIALSEVIYKKFLYNTEFNKYKDMVTGEWLDSDKRDEYINDIETQRINFLAGGYASYGYDPSVMSWEEFLVALYGVKNEQELGDSYLYNDIIADYTALLNFITQTDDEGEYVNSYKDALASGAWELYTKKMEAAIADYFNVKGIHFLVSKYEDPSVAATGGNPVDPAEWTENDKELAKQLIAEVYEYLNAAKGTYATKLQNVVSAFNASPYLVDGQSPVIYDKDGNEVKYDLTFGDVTIDVAKYKSAGLFVKFEDLGSFVNGTMVENFNDAVKAIYDADMKDGLTNRITVLETPIETEFGFHLYINLSSAKIATYDSYKVTVNEEGAWEYVYEDDAKTIHAVEERVYPQLYEILIYTKDSLSEELTSGASTAIASYYTKVAEEISGSYFTYICQYQDLVAVVAENGISDLASYDKADLERMIKLNIESWYENNLERLESGDENIIRGIK